MTEYWKSQSRKYCEFCKCWFADNKVSIAFHESGKRHKENVKKHISQLSKRSAKEYKQKEKMDGTMKKMETAAMAAYLKDVQNNADLTSQSINEMLKKESISEIQTAVVVSVSHNSKSDPIWREVKGEDENSYYWNPVTSETTWNKPDEYMSLEDQKESTLEKCDPTESEMKKKLKKQKQDKKRNDEAVKELKAHIAREKMRERAVKDPPQPRRDYGPAPAVKPYGSWKPVVIEKPKDVDLQLPKVAELPLPPVVMEPEIFKIKEKRVESLGDGPVEFKKRKFNNAHRNIRQKVDDE